MRSPLDAFIPRPDVRERFERRVHAPAGLVLATATTFDLQGLAAIRAIFWLRERLMRAPSGPPRQRQGLIAEMRGLGWSVLAEEPNRYVVLGAACRPWLADPGFTPVPHDQFATYAEPDQVIIAWSLETEALGEDVTRLIHEVRVAATDARARRRFLRYWRWARFGIVAIRLLLLPAIRRQAERRWASRT